MRSLLLGLLIAATANADGDPRVNLVQAADMKRRSRLYVNTGLSAAAAMLKCNAPRVRRQVHPDGSVAMTLHLACIDSAGEQTGQLRFEPGCWSLSTAAQKNLEVLGAEIIAHAGEHARRPRVLVVGSVDGERVADRHEHCLTQTERDWPTRDDLARLCKGHARRSAQCAKALNRALSDRRAHAVASALGAGAMVVDGQLIALGIGQAWHESHVPNATTKNRRWAESRRADIFILLERTKDFLPCPTPAQPLLCLENAARTAIPVEVERELDPDVRGPACPLKTTSRELALVCEHALRLLEIKKEAL